MVKVGDFVTATLLSGKYPVQGVVSRIHDTSMELWGFSEPYLCRKNGVVVPDESLDAETLSFVGNARKSLGV